MMKRSWLALLFLAACSPAGPGALDDGGVTTNAEGDEADVDEDEDDDSDSSSSSSDSDSSDSSAEVESDDFIPRYDEPPPECDPWEQDCPEGEKCVPYPVRGGWDANKCVPVLGDQGAWEPCIGTDPWQALDDCDATSFCWDLMEVDGELHGTCAPFCTGSPDQPECPLGSSCILTSDGSLSLCLKHCSPLLQDCEPGLGCYWVGSDFHCVFTSENLGPGEACGYVNDCAQGLICTPPEFLPTCAGSSCCTSFCELELGDVGCIDQPGTNCVPFFEDGTAPPGYEQVGICILPL